MAVMRPREHQNGKKTGEREGVDAETTKHKAQNLIMRYQQTGREEKQKREKGMGC
jgi:hypothetical protein